MSCEPYRPHLVGLLYDDIGDSDRAATVAHLASCESCRRDYAELAGVRAALRESAPDVPRAPRVLVVGSRASRPRTWLAFAAGIAAALLAAGGAATGYVYGSGRAATVRPVEPPPATADLVAREVDRRWQALQQSVSEASLARSSPDAATITKDDLEAALRRLERKIDGSRASDLDYVQNLVAASERRTGNWIGETQKALRYVALANNPALSER